MMKKTSQLKKIERIERYYLVEERNVDDPLPKR